MRMFIYINVVFLLLIASGCQVVINPEVKMHIQQGSDIIENGLGSFDFGKVLKDENTVEETFTIFNTGKKALKLTGSPNKIDITGENPEDFYVDETQLNNTITENHQSTFKIIFNPKSLGVKSAIISIKSNEEDNTPYTFSIKGIAVSPEIVVKQGDSIFSSGTSEYDFNEMYVGYFGPSVTFTIMNTGSGNLYLNGTSGKIGLSGPDASNFILDDTSTSQTIEPQSETHFNIVFNPATTGTKTATISILNNDQDENPFTFTITGTAIDPGILIMDSNQIAIVNGSGSFDFGKVLREASIVETFTIKNLGSSNLLLTGNPKVTLSGTGSSAYTVTLQPSSPILPGQSASLSISFSPIFGIFYDATVSIPNNDYHDNPYTFKLKGTGIEPEIHIKDSSNNDIIDNYGHFNFGDVNVGISTSETFTIQNLGEYELILDGSPKVKLSGTGVSVFNVVTQPNSPISPGSSTTFTIEIIATDDTMYDASVSISNNDIDESTYTFHLHARGMKREINIKQGSNDILSGTGSYNFGSEYVGFPGQSVVFTIENKGNLSLNLTGSPNLIEISGVDATMFSIDELSTYTPITAFNWTIFSIIFSPTSVGNKSATISIPNDDSDENPYTFTIIGTGLTPAPEINIKHDTTNIPNSTGTYNFNNTAIGDSSQPSTFKIENLGVLNLNLSGSPIVEISGTNASEFSLNISSTITPVTPSGSTSFTITFAPVTVGNKTATVSIPNDDPDENPYTFTLLAYAFVGGIGQAIGWIGGGSDGWKTTNGISNSSDYRGFWDASGVFVDSAGYIYVADASNNRVCKWDSAGNAIGWIGGGSNGWKTGSVSNSGTDYRSFWTPVAVAVDSAGYIYVVDHRNSRISKWDSNGNAIGWIGGSKDGWQTGAAPSGGSNYRAFYKPFDVCLDSNGFIYIADWKNCRISKWSSTGIAVGWIGGGSNGWKTGSCSCGRDYQSFYEPKGVFVNTNGDIYVCDTYNSRISKWDSAGNAIGWFGHGSDGWKTSTVTSATGKDYRSFYYPQRLHIDSKGFIFITDLVNYRVCKWDSQGNAIGWIGNGSDGWKTTDGPNDEDHTYQGFWNALGIFVDSNHYIYIADQDNNRVCKWVD